MPELDRADTPFLTHEMCADKRPLGAFETDWAGYPLQLRHQPNVFGTGFVACTCGLIRMRWSSLAYRQPALVTNVGSTCQSKVEIKPSFTPVRRTTRLTSATRIGELRTFRAADSGPSSLAPGLGRVPQPDYSRAGVVSRNVLLEPCDQAGEFGRPFARREVSA